MALTRDQISDIVFAHLQERGRELGANLGNLLRRTDPSFKVSDYDMTSLSELLRATVSGAVVVGRQGGDYVWALGEDLSDRDLARALLDDDDGAAEPSATGAPDKVQWVTLEGFRSCKTTRLDLDDFTLLVGGNGAGKTTLLLGASYACQLNRGLTRALFSGPRDLLRIRTYGYAQPVRLTLHTTQGAEMSLEGTPDPYEPTYVLTHMTKGKKPTRWRFPPPTDQKSPPPSPTASASWPAIYLRLSPDSLAAPSQLLTERPRLGFDGYGLPSVLAHLATNEPERLAKIVERIRELIPRFRRVRMPLKMEERPRFEYGVGEDGHDRVQSRASPRMLYTLEVEVEGSGWVPADLLSEGTLFVLGIHTLLEQATPPRIVLLDDIDRGLHPKAQQVLMDQLSHIAKAGTQIVASTHSPYALDQISPNAVRVVRATAEGGTQCRKLTDHPEWSAWSGSMLAGEFWTFVGEDWLEGA